MSRTRRPGFTLLEMTVVLGLILILGAVIVPSLDGFYGNTKQRAAADILRTRLSEARAKAMERGVPIRVAINSDKTRIRTGPDTEDFGTVEADADPPAFDSLATEDTLDDATVELLLDDGDDRKPDSAGWTTVATMRADGSSKEARSVTVIIKQRDFAPIQIQVRGLIGQARTLSNAKNGSQQ
ncbi:MAG: prepilin-type N-terminal cleavage/methylation domain-containing protein [Planctomycetes bacterium]|nr:prepilin-type N-terminal cleavage/methylation domain-containing protein [Planctomycetota bacterium]